MLEHSRGVSGTFVVFLLSAGRKGVMKTAVLKLKFIRTWRTDEVEAVQTLGGRSPTILILIVRSRNNGQYSWLLTKSGHSVFRERCHRPTAWNTRKTWSLRGLLHCSRCRWLQNFYNPALRVRKPCVSYFRDLWSLQKCALNSPGKFFNVHMATFLTPVTLYIFEEFSQYFWCTCSCSKPSIWKTVSDGFQVAGPDDNSALFFSLHVLQDCTLISFNSILN